MSNTLLKGSQIGAGTLSAALPVSTWAFVMLGRVSRALFGTGGGTQTGARAGRCRGHHVIGGGCPDIRRGHGHWAS